MTEKKKGFLGTDWLLDTPEAVKRETGYGEQQMSV